MPVATVIILSIKHYKVIIARAAPAGGGRTPRAVLPCRYCIITTSPGKTARKSAEVAPLSPSPSVFIVSPVRRFPKKTKKTLNIIASTFNRFMCIRLVYLCFVILYYTSNYGAVYERKHFYE